MSQRPSRQKSLREYIRGLSVWSKIGWTILLGYIVGRVIYWINHLLQ